MDRYLCAKCLRRFPINKALDGYAQGYQCGFLCPLCGANLVENGQPDDIDNLQYGYRYAFLVFIIASATPYLPWQLDTFTSDIANECLLMGSLLLAPSLVFLKINAKRIFGHRLVFTRIILHKT